MNEISFLDINYKIDEKNLLFTCLIIMLFIIFISIVAFLMISSYGNSKILNPNITTVQMSLVDPNNINYGTEFQKGCPKDKHGPVCNIDTHNKNFFGVTYDLNDIKYKIEKTETVSDKNTCSNMCLSNCIGFVYKDKKCSLLKENVITDEIPKFDPQIENELFLRNNSYLDIYNYVFISKDLLSLPKRYWLFNYTKDYQKIIPGVLYSINFIPGYVINHSNYTGYYSTQKFSISDIEKLKEYGDEQFYVSYPNQKLEISNDFLYKVIYVIYS